MLPSAVPFGADSLTLAQPGAIRAIEAARNLANELGLAGQARFVHAGVYDAVEAIPAPHAFDLVFVTWGAICRLPDITQWAQIVAGMAAAGRIAVPRRRPPHRLRAR